MRVALALSSEPGANVGETAQPGLQHFLLADWLGQTKSYDTYRETQDSAYDSPKRESWNECQLRQLLHVEVYERERRGSQKQQSSPEKQNVRIFHRNETHVDDFCFALPETLVENDTCCYNKRRHLHDTERDLGAYRPL